MTIDKEYVKEVLNHYVEVAFEVNAVKQEIVKERDLDNDDKFSWRDQETIKTFLNFGITRLLDEYLPKGQH